ncbi:MAG: glycosyltransferase [Ignavibacteria bacterium]|nr:glycosyltransferase [Ignavibacteria bacterium]
MLDILPETEIPVFFSVADVCVLPYRTATQSGIVGIAYHFDLPVIATNVGGLAEMVEENRTGLVISEPKTHLIYKEIKKNFSEELKDKFAPHITEYKSQHSWQYLAEDIISFTEQN